MQTLAQVSYDGAANLPASYGTSASTGMVVTATDQAGKSRRQVVDALGRVRRADEPNDARELGPVNTPVQATYYDYDVLDNLLHVEQRESAQVVQHRYFKYDSLSRLKAERMPEQDAPHTLTDSLTGNNQWSRVSNYLADGRVSDSIDARSITTAFTYDGLNRVQVVNYSDATPDVTYTYDQARSGYYNNGQLTEVRTAAVAGTVTTPAIPETKLEYDHDLMGQTVAHRTTIGGTLYTQSYAYGGLGNVKSQTYPSGRVVNYGHDWMGRLTSVADQMSGVTQTYTSGTKYYAHGGMQEEIWGNGAVQTTGFNSRLQLTTINLDKSGNLLQRYEYTYGQVNIDTGAPNTANNGQIGRIDAFIGRDGQGTPVRQWQQRFAYDSVGRLSRAREVRADDGTTAWQQHFTYDRFGNRYQAPAGTPDHYNEGLGWISVTDADIDRTRNRYRPAFNITYDAAGQITYDGRFRRPNLYYDHDANGRLRSSKATPSDTTTSFRTNVTDASGNRVQLIFGINASSRNMVYDLFGRMIAEYYPGLLHENIYRGGGGLLAKRTSGGVVQWVMNDHQGSARAIVNAAGAVVERHDYLPFGEELFAGTGQRGGQPYNVAAQTVRQRFAQTEREYATTLEHTPWRKLDTRAGRWTTPDPYLGSMSVGDPQSMNRYAYVQNDPVNFVDPSGLNMSSGGCSAEFSYAQCGGDSGFWGGGTSGGYGFGDGYAWDQIAYGDLPANLREGQNRYLDSINTALYGGGATYGDGIHVTVNVRYDGTLEGAIGALNRLAGYERGWSIGRDNTPTRRLQSPGIQTMDGEIIGGIITGAGVGAITRAVLGRVAGAVAGWLGRSEGSTASAASTFFNGTRYTDKVLMQMRKGDFHSFPDMVINSARYGHVTSVRGGDGVVRQMLEIPGAYEGRQGVFQFIKEANGAINHRLFVPRP